MPYSIDDFTKDWMHAMISRPNEGHFSGRALGNTANQALWTTAKTTSFYNGIVAAYLNFFRSEFADLKTFARLVMCECMQESTGNYNLGVRPVDFKDHTSHGLIQVTPASVLLDYKNYGQPIVDANGKLLVVPSLTKEFDLSDPGINIIIWAWYTKNCVIMGVSMNEWVHKDVWHIPTGGVPKNFGNCQLCWLAGPGVGREKNKTAFQDYHNRILDYWVASGFGTVDEYTKHIDTLLVGGINGMYPDANHTINNRDTCYGICNVGKDVSI